MNNPSTEAGIVVLISAQAEWQVVEERYPGVQYETSPFGRWFQGEIDHKPVIFFHGGWGKISAAASTQFVIDRWRPRLTG